MHCAVERNGFCWGWNGREVGLWDGVRDGGMEKLSSRTGVVGADSRWASM